MKKLSLVVIGLWCALVSAAFAPLFTPPINLVSTDVPPSSFIERPVVALTTGNPSISSTYATASYMGRSYANGSSDAAYVAFPIPIAGTISNLYVTGVISSSPGNVVTTIIKNGATTSLTCTITSSTSCNNTSDSVTVAAGDNIVVRFTPSGSPANMYNLVVSTKFTSTGAGTLIGGSTSANTTGTTYVPFGGSSTSDHYATEASASVIVPTAGTIDKLYVKAIDYGSGGSFTGTLYKNGSATSITCSASIATTTCSDTTNSVSVSANDTISFQFSTGSDVSRPHFSAQWTPSIAGEVPIFGVNGSASALNNTGTNLYGPENASWSNYQYIAPVSLTMKKLSVKLETSPGASETWTFFATKNGVNQSLTCFVTGASGTTCSDTINTASISATNAFGWAAVPSSSPANSRIKISGVVTVP